MLKQAKQAHVEGLAVSLSLTGACLQVPQKIVSDGSARVTLSGVDKNYPWKLWTLRVPGPWCCFPGQVHTGRCT